MAPVRRGKWWLWLLGLVLVLALGAFAAQRWLLVRVVSFPQLQGELLDYRSVHNGLQRHYRVYRPSSLSASAPVLFVLHGSMSDGLDIRHWSARQFDRLADEQGILVVYPDGYEKHWNGCRASANYAANTENIDDVGFFRQLVSELQAEFGIDPERVFATGLSNGGHMALRLALEAPDLVAAVAPMAASLPADDYLGCSPSGKAVSIAVVNGTTDTVNPYQGGKVTLLWDDSRGVVQSTPAMMAYFAGLAGVTGEPTSYSLDDSEPEDNSVVEVQVWRGATEEVRLYRVVGAGHSFPSRNTYVGPLMGGGNRDVDIADELWGFFSRLP